MSLGSLNGGFRTGAQHLGQGCVDSEQGHPAAVLAGSVPLRVNACVARRNGPRITVTSPSMMFGAFRNSIVGAIRGCRQRSTIRPNVVLMSAHNRNVPSCPPQNAAYTKRRGIASEE